MEPLYKGQVKNVRVVPLYRGQVKNVRVVLLYRGQVKNVRVVPLYMHGTSSDLSTLKGRCNQKTFFF